MSLHGSCLLTLLLSQLVACSAGPDLPQPAGRRFDVYIRDARTLE